MVIALLFVPLPLGQTHTEYSLKYFSRSQHSNLLFWCAIITLALLPHCGDNQKLIALQSYPIGRRQWLQMTGALT